MSNPKGAVGTVVVAEDGSGDTTDIQTGLDMLPATGGCLYIKEGTYTLTASINIPNNNVSVVGCGRSTHIIQTAAVNIINGASYTGITIEKLFLDGDTNTSLSGISFVSTTDSKIFNCWIEDTGEDGINISTSAENPLIYGNVIRNCYENGIVALTINEGTISNNFIDNMGLNLAGTAGINLSYTNNTTIANNSCSSDDANGVNGILLGWSNHNVITGNQCSENSYNGILLLGSLYNTITNNVCLNNSHGYSNTYDGIKLREHTIVAETRYSNNNIVDGNECNDDQVTATQRSGIYFQNGNYNIASNNQCYANYNYGIYTSGENYADIVGNSCIGNRNSHGIILGSTTNHSNVSDNLCYNNEQNGIVLITGGLYNSINNNLCLGNVTRGIEIGGVCNHNSISENICEENGSQGIILFGASYNTVSGNTCLNNSNITAISDGIYLYDSNGNNSTYNILNGNQCNDSQGIATQRYGINERNSSQNYNTITNNTCIGNTTGPINSLGPNDLVFSNTES